MPDLGCERIAENARRQNEGSDDHGGAELVPFKPSADEGCCQHRTERGEGGIEREFRSRHAERRADRLDKDTHRV
ncbi:hypothetical protein SDC9_129158 [bioreactor metagenome]|uniref:Uncharacterized protein n=1 Tax=bioreactor metagenome TaxID=1076179 RepID=A0A645CY21_9ZZZZ